jgi:hypothetical protein
MIEKDRRYERNQKNSSINNKCRSLLILCICKVLNRLVSSQLIKMRKKSCVQNSKKWEQKDKQKRRNLSEIHDYKLSWN